MGFFSVALHLHVIIVRGEMRSNPRKAADKAGAVGSPVFLIYPSGDWLGRRRQASGILDRQARTMKRRSGPHSGSQGIRAEPSS